MGYNLNVRRVKLGRKKMTTKRTDKHCPSKIQPDEYQYVAME